MSTDTALAVTAILGTAALLMVVAAAGLRFRSTVLRRIAAAEQRLAAVTERLGMPDAVAGAADRVALGADVVALVAAGRRPEAVRLYRQRTGADLTDAIRAVDDLVVRER